jgi:hypothetical protein
VEAIFAARGFSLVIELVAGNESHIDGNAIGVHQEEMACRVVRRAAPVHTADVTGENNDAFDAGRRENSFIAHGFDSLRAPLTLF